LGQKDFAAARFLLELELWRAAGERPEPLVHFRHQFRLLAEDRPVAGLAWCLRQGDAETRRLAVWLLGRSGDTSSIPLVAYYLQRADRKLRITVARALKRLHSRAELEQMAEEDCDAWIRGFAAAHAKRSFRRQLESFAPELETAQRHAADRPKSTMPLVVNVARFQRQPPKSAEVIRAILMRIRDLLRGPSRAGNGH
jgi:hypothetical protein